MVKRTHVKWSIIFGIIMIALILMTGLFIYKDYVVEASEQRYAFIHLVPNSSEVTEALFSEKDQLSIKQTFVSSVDTIDGLNLQIEQRGNISEIKLKVLLIDEESGATLEKWSPLENSEELQDGQIELILEKPLKGAKNKEFSIQIVENNIDDTNQVAFVSTKYNRINHGNLFVDNEEKKGDLCCSVYSGIRDSLRTEFLFFLALLVIVVTILLVTLNLYDLRLDKIFIAFGFGMGILYLILIPAYSAPDEMNHLASAYATSNTIMLQENVDDNNQVMVRGEDRRLFYEGTSLSSNTYITIGQNLFTKSVGDSKVSGGQGALKAPFYTYLAPGIAISIARILHLNNVWLLFLARLANLAVYVFLVAFGIKYMPSKKMILFVVGLLPMSLSIAASCSYDALTNGLSFAFIGYVLYLAFEKDSIKKKDWIILIVLMAFLAPIKVVYIFLGLLCFIIPKRKLQTSFPVVVQRGIVFVEGLVVISCFRVSAIISSLGTSKLSVTATGGAVDLYSVSQVFHQPVHTIAIFLRTILERTEFYLVTMIGESLGALSVYISQTVVIGFAIVLVLAVIFEREKIIEISIKNRVCFAIISFFVIGSVMGVMLLSWTGSTDLIIQGVQGRYFLPILPLVILAVCPYKDIVNKNACQITMGGIIVLQWMAMFDVIKSVIK